MTMVSVSVVVLALVYWLPVIALSTYYMDEHCGESISLVREHTNSLSLKLTSSENYGANMNCYVTFTAETGSYIMTSFVWVDIGSFRRCPGDFVQIFNSSESLNSSSRGAESSRICGHSKPDVTWVSVSNDITVRFVSDGHFFGKGFHLVITQFRHGPCTDSDFSCDNSRCVHADLACRGQADSDTVFNHCGDFSNGCRATGLVIATIVLSIVVFVVTVFVISVVAWFRVQRAKQGDDDDDDGGAYREDWGGLEHEVYVVESNTASSSRPAPFTPSRQMTSVATALESMTSTNISVALADASQWVALINQFLPLTSHPSFQPHHR